MAFGMIDIDIVGKDLLRGHFCAVDLPYHILQGKGRRACTPGKQYDFMYGTGNNIEIIFDVGSECVQNVLVEKAGCAEDAVIVGKDTD